MIIINFDILLLITTFHVSHCERRIVGGEQVTAEKSYVVYLVKATMSDKDYDSWLCGGAIVTKDFIITSAACVEDVHYMYAIAGYRKYVNDKQLERDDCTKQMKKKIVYTCVPISYEFNFNKIEKWAHIDIALVKVESPYNFDDARYQLMCSYVPSIIPINYDRKRQANNVDALVLGWGHAQYWRQHGDHINYNQEYLRFASTTLFDKVRCQGAYKDYQELTNIIEKYMICSMDHGHLNDHGVPYSVQRMPGRDSCITQQQKTMGLQGELCQVELTSEQPEQALMNHLVHDGDETRKRMNEKSKNITNFNVNGTGFLKGTDNDNRTDNVHGTDNDNGTDIVNGTDIANGANIVNATDNANGTDIVNETDSIDRTDFIYKPSFGNISGYFNRTFTRRNGICQNDHGGPLVTWVGKREVLIGVASVFKITDKNRCIGPFLYTSTVCSGAFIGCVLNDRRANILRGKDASVSTSKALFCDSPPSVKGFDTIESYISWKDHPSGPADNEKHLRDQLEPNLMKDRYATNVKEEDSKTHEQATNDRFSLKIGVPPGIRPRKRYPLRKRPSPINSPPSELPPPPITRPPTEMKRPPIIRPPVDMVPSPILWAPPSTTIRPEPQMEPLAFDDILNFKSDEVFMKKRSESNPNPKANQPSSVVQRTIQIRPQSPLRG